MNDFTKGFLAALGFASMVLFLGVNTTTDNFFVYDKIKKQVFLEDYDGARPTSGFWVNADGELSLGKEVGGAPSFTFGRDVNDPTTPAIQLTAPYSLGKASLVDQLSAKTVVVQGASLYFVNPADVDPVTKMPKEGAILRHDAIDFTTGETIYEMVEKRGAGYVRRPDLEKPTLGKGRARQP